MQLLLLHPEVAYRSCEDCKKFIYNHETGVREDWPPGSGRPVPRPPGMLPPCSIGPKACAKISPEANVELNERNQRVYRHYLECRATGTFPDDPIVRENAAIIRSIEDAADRIETRNNFFTLAGMTTPATHGGTHVYHI